MLKTNFNGFRQILQINITGVEVKSYSEPNMYSRKQSQEIGKHLQPVPRNKSVVFCVQCAVSWVLLGNARLGSYNRIFVTFSLLYALSVKLRSILVKCQHNHRFGLLNEILCLLDLEQNKSKNTQIS